MGTLSKWDKMEFAVEQNRQVVVAVTGQVGRRSVCGLRPTHDMSTDSRCCSSLGVKYSVLCLSLWYVRP